MTTRMLTISDLYNQDVADDAIFILEFPISCSKLLNDERFLRNKTKYLIDDEYKVPPYENWRMELPMRAMAVFGDKARVHTAVKLDPELEEHWNRKLGNRGSLRFASLGEDVNHVVLFPMEVVPKEHHAVDADCHYRVHSKAFITTIPCPQAPLYQSMRLPAVIKACRAAGAEGTWMVNSGSEYKARMEWLKESMPRADVIVCEKVKDVVNEYSCHMYINKKGEMTWMGSSGNAFEDDGFWAGGFIDLTIQEKVKEKCLPALEPVVQALHDNNYFGWCGVDVLEDSKGKLYVVDINARLCGSTSLILTSKVMKNRGWTCGLLKTGCSFQRSLPEVLAQAEAAEGGEVVILSAYFQQGITHCQAAFFSTTRQACSNLANSLHQQANQ